MRLQLAIIATALIVVGAAAGATGNQQQQLRHSTNVIRFFDNHQWMLAQRHSRCGTVAWSRTCAIARRVYKTHQIRAAKLKVALYRSLPYTNDWRTAVRLAQRVYPGTSDWLLFISHREGGYGGFVMNHQGSGAGGWMQFMSGTFYGYVGAARADFARRGFQVDPSVWVWTHPLGQALTAGYMRFTGRDGCHWCL